MRKIYSSITTISNFTGKDQISTTRSLTNPFTGKGPISYFVSLDHFYCPKKAINPGIAKDYPGHYNPSLYFLKPITLSKMSLKKKVFFK
jgi:hypothetical protein